MRESKQDEKRRFFSCSSWITDFFFISFCCCCSSSNSVCHMCCVLEIIHRIRCFPLLFISFVNITSSHFVVFAGSILIPAHVYHFVPSQSLLYYLLLFIRWFVEFNEIARRSHADARQINGMNGRHLIDCSIDWKLERNVENANKQTTGAMYGRTTEWVYSKANRRNNGRKNNEKSHPLRILSNMLLTHFGHIAQLQLPKNSKFVVKRLLPAFFSSFFFFFEQK